MLQKSIFLCLIPIIFEIYWMYVENILKSSFIIIIMHHRH